MSLSLRGVRVALSVFVVAGVACLLLAATTQPEPPASALTDRRLERLDPSDPEAYFLLAEEAADIGEAETARRLFGLAAALEPAQFGRSACLAIASMEAENSAARVRYLALAEMHPQAEARGPVPEPVTWTAVPGNDLGPAYASAVIGYHRIGEDRRAHRLQDTLPALEAYLEEPPAGMSLILEEVRLRSATQPVCETCQNRQVTVCPACNGNTSVACATCRGRRVTLCRTCDGRPGQKPDISALSSQLRLELTLLAGAEAGWSDQLQLDRGSARHLLLPGRLAETLGIDPAATIYRNGRWERP